MADESELRVKRLEAAIAALTDGLFLAEPDGLLDPLNAAGASLVGVLSAEQDLLTPLLERVWSSGKSVRETVLTRDHAYEVSASPLVARRDAAVVLVRDVTAQRRTEQELREEILQVSSREQRWIGQTLHDGLCQQLVGISLLAQGIAKRAKGTPGAAIATEVVNMLSKAAEDTRRLAKGLCPVALETSGLGSALEELAGSFQKMYPEVAVEVERGEDEVYGPRDPVATHLYHIAQEAISNAVQHGAAQRVSVSLTEEEGAVELTVENDGEPFVEPSNPEGMGLRSMRYRAQMLGAELKVAGQERGGTRVTCRLVRET